MKDLEKEGKVLMETGRQEARKLLDWINKSPSPYHVIQNLTNELLEAGYKKLEEDEVWNLQKEGRYFVSRNASSLLAFRLPAEADHFQIIASHSDSPGFRVKEHGEIVCEKKLVSLNTEPYGGMLMASWLDRPLSLAGRVILEEGGELRSHLLNIDRDLLMIPSLAIHMARGVNEGKGWNPQTELLPLFADYREGAGESQLLSCIAEAGGLEANKIRGMDLFLYNRMKGSIWGAKEEYMSSPKLDDLECVYGSFRGFLDGDKGERRSDGKRGMIPVFAVFDNEEVGSQTRQGAGSSFLKESLLRMVESLGMTMGDYCRMIAGSFLLSADNAHSVHPNYKEKSDPTNRPWINGGIVLKYHGGQKYTTDGMTGAIVEELCRKTKISCQTFFNRSDQRGGSTLGNISQSQVSLPAADIGLPQLAMHSSYETAGISDYHDYLALSKAFYTTEIKRKADGIYRLLK